MGRDRTWINAVAIKVGVGEDEDEVSVGLLGGDRVDRLLGGVERLIAGPAELGMRDLQRS